MGYLTFISAVFILLLSPGPTNTLMGLASARGSLWQVLKLLPAELLGYLTMILPLTWLGEALIDRWPVSAVVLKVAAASWVMYLATKLWLMASRDDEHDGVTAQRIYVTTLLNPKALVFGLVFLPRPTEPDFMPKLALFFALASMVAIIWGVIGRFTQAGTRSTSRLLILQRAASIWLAIVSCTVVAGLFQS